MKWNKQAKCVQRPNETYLKSRPYLELKLKQQAQTFSPLSNLILPERNRCYFTLICQSCAGQNIFYLERDRTVLARYATGIVSVSAYTEMH